VRGWQPRRSRAAARVRSRSLADTNTLDCVNVNEGFVYREQVGASHGGRSVLGHLCARYRHSSEAAWRERLARGEVTLDGRSATADDLLRPGQWLVWTRPPWEEPMVPLSFAVLHLDSDLLAVAKPRGLPSVPGGGFLAHTLLHRVRRRWPEAVPLHRLGRGTSGLVLFARSALGRRRLAADWREGRVDKVYRALVHGAPVQTEFTVAVPIGCVPHPRLGHVHAASVSGRPARTDVRVLEQRGVRALVEARIPTGRPHQIRIHLAAAGHPLVGDPLYGAGGLPLEDPALPGDGGYWLHAHRLGLAHPATGTRLELECPPPPILRAAPPIEDYPPVRTSSGSASR
jgi:23S rRNA pseudouridine1911/1915/1917 synthase